jgi:DNA-binding NarL/FixJ family response regulator
MTTDIVIADDADLIILGVCAALESNRLQTTSRYRVVGQARSLPALRAAVEDGQPDVVILSEWIYGIDVLSAVEQISQLRPTVKVIVMGGLADGLLIRDLFTYGVNGYLYKSDDLGELLITAIETVLRGRPYLSPTANAEYIIAMQSPDANARLDPEARQVLQLLAHGDHVGQIGQQLGIGVRRVYWVREKLRRRFGAKTNEHLISRAAAEGFIHPRA